MWAPVFVTIAAVLVCTTRASAPSSALLARTVASARGCSSTACPRVLFSSLPQLGAYSHETQPYPPYADSIAGRDYGVVKYTPGVGHTIRGWDSPAGSGYRSVFSVHNAFAPRPFEVFRPSATNIGALNHPLYGECVPVAAEDLLCFFSGAGGCGPTNRILVARYGSSPGWANTLSQTNLYADGCTARLGTYAVMVDDVEPNLVLICHSGPACNLWDATTTQPTLLGGRISAFGLGPTVVVATMKHSLASSNVFILCTNLDDADGSGVFFAIATQSGTGPVTYAVSAPIQLNQVVAGDQVFSIVPSASFTPLVGGGFVAAWKSDSFAGDSGGTAAVARFFDDSGAPLTDDFLLPHPGAATSLSETHICLVALAEPRSFAYFYTQTAAESRIFAGTATLHPGTFSPSSATNTVLWTTPLARIVTDTVIDPGSQRYMAGSRLASFYPAGPRYDQIDVFVARKGSTFLAVDGYLDEHVIFLRDAHVLDAPTCTTLGTTPFTLDCLAAILGSPEFGAGHTVTLPAGVWTGCPPLGVHLNTSFVLTGAGEEATVIDCASSGRAFLIDAAQVTDLVPLSLNSMVIANLSIVNGAVGHDAATQPNGDVGGGCILVRNSASRGGRVSIEHITITDCTVASNAAAYVDAPLGSTPGATRSFRLFGGCVGALDVSDLWLGSVTMARCSLAIDGLPDLPPANPRIPYLLGGAIGFLFSDALASGYVPHAERESSARGLVLDDVSITTSAATTSSPVVAGGGGGIAVAHVPVTLPRVIVTNVTVTANTVSGRGLLGGGIFLSKVVMNAATELHFLGGSSQITHNVAWAGARGGGLALVDVTDTGGAVTLVYDVHILHNVADSGAGGGGLYVERTSSGNSVSVKLDGCVVDGNQATATGAGGGAHVVDASLVLNSTVVSGNTAAVSGGGIYVAGTLTADLFVLADVALTANTAAAGSGGGVHFSSLGKLSFSGSISANSAALYGGGVHIDEGIMFVSAPTALVSGNTAAVGGGIFECLFSTACGATEASGCGSARANNPAAMSAVDFSGVLLLPEYASATTDDVRNALVFGNNGGNVASDAVTLSFAAPAPAATVTDVQAGSFLFPSLLSAYDRTNAVSGIPFSVAITSLAWTPARLAAAGITAADAGDPASLVLTGAVCEGVTGHCDLSELQVTVKKAEDADKVYAVRLALAGAPCIRVTTPAEVYVRVTGCAGRQVAVESTSLTCQTVCGPGERVSGIDCIPCEPGTSLFLSAHQQATCTPCDVETYALGGAVFCKPCPPGGECGNGTFVHPKPGFWYPVVINASSQASSDIVSFVACDPPEACPGGASFSACARGYRRGSFACFACDAGYTKAGSKCLRCAPSYVSIILVALCSLAILVFVVTTIRSALSTSKAAAYRSQLVKIGINVAQTLALLVQLRAQRSRLMNSHVTPFVGAASISLSSFPVACMAKLSVYDKFLISLAIPPIALAVCVATYVVHWLGSARAKGDSLSLALSRAGRAAAIVYFLVYPTILSVTFGMFHCKATNVRPGLWLLADLDIRCYSGPHTAYATIAALSILVYVVGGPAAFFFYLARARSSHGHAWAVSTHAFFVAGYRPSVYFWEAVIVARKAALSVIIVFATRTMEQLQIATVAVVAIVVLQSRALPYDRPGLNVAELAGLLVVAVAVSSNMVTLTDAELDEEADTAGRATKARSNYVLVVEWLVVTLVFIYFATVAASVLFAFGSGTHALHRKHRIGARDDSDLPDHDNADDAVTLSRLPSTATPTCSVSESESSA